MVTNNPIYPLKFEPIYKEKVWGARTLETLGRTLPGGKDTLIGESWELADMGATSPWGAGGEAARSIVSNGPLKNSTLHELLQTDRQALVGDLPLTATGDFPLLVKFLDAGQNLSVQTHPSTAYVKAHPEAHLKSEAWYIVKAAPGAVIYKGVHEGVSPAQFRRAIERDTVEPLLVKVPVKAGVCHYLPSGTCHALGAGILVAEVQTPSDTTFRVYDWGRTTRQLHIEQALQCLHFGPAQVSEYELNVSIAGEKAQTTRLVTCEYFRIDRYRVEQGYTDVLGDGQPKIWMCLAGGGRMTSDVSEPVDFAVADTIFLPALMSGGQVTLRNQTTWLEVTFPQAEPWRIA